MSKLKKIFCYVLIFAMVLMLLMSCKGEETPVLPIITPYATATQNGATGGELILPMPENADFDSPLIVNTEEMLALYSLIFESLLTVDDITGKLAPELAETWSCDAATGRIWTVKLRKNVKWHNGQSFTADDFIYTYNKLLSEIDTEYSQHIDIVHSYEVYPLGTTVPQESITPTEPVAPTSEPQTTPEVTTEPIIEPTTEPLQPTTAPTPSESPTPTQTQAPTPSPTVEPTYAPSYADASYYAYHVGKIESVDKLDDSTLLITMKEAGLSSLFSLTFPVMCKNTLETEKLIGTGAYRFDRSTEETAELSVNTAWWKKLPFIEKITFEARVNNETALASYEAGQLNFVPTSLVSAGKFREDGTTNVIDIMTQNAEFLAYNYDNSILGDTAVRKAIAYGIDIGSIISNVYMNRAQACDVPIAPDSFLYDTKSKIYSYDIEHAKKLLADAGYTDSDKDGVLESSLTHDELSFVLLVSESSDNTLRRSVADSIAASLAECGIKITVEGEYYSLKSKPSESNYIRRLYARDFDIVLTGMNLSRDCDLRCIFEANGSANFGGISDPEILALSKGIVTAGDETSMREAAYAFQSEFIESMPFTMLYFRKNSIVYTATLKGIGTIREPDILFHVSEWYLNTETQNAS